MCKITRFCGIVAPAILPFMVTINVSLAAHARSTRLPATAVARS